MTRADSRRPIARPLIACGLAATAALLLGNAVAAQRSLEGVNGVEAIGALGNRIADVARHHAMTPQDLAALFESDDTLWLLDDDRLVYIDTAVPEFEHQPGVAPEAIAGIPLENALFLQTDPGADLTIYLDFDGHHSVNNSWGHDIVFPPYNVDGSSNTFTDAELAEIIAIWRHVAEDFSPFNVNVTTMDPGVAALTRSGGSDPTYGSRCIMTQPTSGFGNGIGGVAQLHSFDDSLDNPVFVFNKGENPGGMSASHEVGHALGLSHDGLFGQQYHPGSGSGSTGWGPIMGAPFGQNLVQWSKGEYSGATNTQDDVALILGYIPARPDDHADALASATPFDEGCSTMQGVIGTAGDVDVFEFATEAGTVSLLTMPDDPAPNVDIKLTVRDESGDVMFAYNPLNGIAAS
ncbi:MAG: PKD domain-containing protein, partial [Planctomycetota bacterium]